MKPQASATSEENTSGENRGPTRSASRAALVCRISGYFPHLVKWSAGVGASMFSEPDRLFRLSQGFLPGSQPDFVYRPGPLGSMAGMESEKYGSETGGCITIGEGDSSIMITDITGMEKQAYGPMDGRGGIAGWLADCGTLAPLTSRTS